MNTRKDYIRASVIVRLVRAEHAAYPTSPAYTANVVRDAFVKFFEADNPRFDAARFRAACEGEAE